MEHLIFWRQGLHSCWRNIFSPRCCWGGSGRWCCCRWRRRPWCCCWGGKTRREEGGLGAGLLEEWQNIKKGRRISHHHNHHHWGGSIFLNYNTYTLQHIKKQGLPVRCPQGWSWRTLHWQGAVSETRLGILTPENHYHLQNAEFIII